METTEQIKTETKVAESTVKTSGHDGDNTVVTIHKTIKSFLLSRKLWATLLSLVLLWLMFWKQVSYLFLFAAYSPEIASVLIPAYTGLTRDVMVCFTAIIGAYLGIQGLIQWRHGSETILNQASSFIKESKEQTNTNNTNTKEEKTENINHRIEHVYVQGEKGAPETKPFAKIDDTNGQNTF